jgi:hypothetical protein
VSPALYALLVASTLFELAPVVAALRHRPLLGALPRPRLLVALCFALMFAQDAALWWLRTRQENNLWLVYVGVPVQTALLLAAYAHWQVGPVERRAVRLAAVGFVALWAALVAWFEDTQAFSRFATPLQAILIVSVVAWTMVRRSTRTMESPASESWFWVSAGLLVYYGSGAVLGPVSNLLFRDAPHLVRAAFTAKAAVNIVAYLLVARGMLCKLPSGSSGGSSSPPASSPSSSPPPSWSRS